MFRFVYKPVNRWKFSSCSSLILSKLGEPIATAVIIYVKQIIFQNHNSKASKVKKLLELLMCRDRNKEKFLHVRRTCDHVRLTCPPIFSHVQKIMHRSTQNYKFRKTGTILNYFKIQQIVGRCCFM